MVSEVSEVSDPVLYPLALQNRKNRLMFVCIWKETAAVFR